MVTIMSKLITKCKEYLTIGLSLLIGYFLVVFKLRGDKLAKLEAKDLVIDENNKQKALDEAVKKAKEEYEGNND